MRLHVILTAVFISLSSMLCLPSAGTASKDAYERLRILHMECEKAYMKNDFFQMKELLDRSLHILDSLYMSGEAMESMSQAYALFHKDKGSYHYCLADMRDEDYQEAWNSYQAALAIYEEYDNDPLKKASVNAELAQLYYKAEMYGDALVYLEDNLAIYEKGWDEAAFRTLSEMALCKARLSRFDEALDDIEFAIEEGGRYDRNLEMLRKKGKILALQDEVRGEGLKEAAVCFKRYFEAQRDSIKANFMTMSSAERERYWMRIHSFVTDCYRIGAQDPGFLYDVTLFSKNILLQFSDRRNAPVNVTWKDIQKNLRKGECAVEFICFESYGKKHMAALVLNRTGQPSYRYICPVEDLLNGYINAPVTVRDALESSNLDYKDDLYRSEWIGALIWTPTLKELKDISKIYFAPDGIFHQIAIEYIFPEFLGVKPAFHRLTGTRELVKERKKTDNDKMLLCGGIDFHEDSGAKAAHRNDRFAYHLLKDREPYFTDIPNTLKEVDSVFVLRGAPDDCLLTGAEATEARCRSIFNDFPVVMISTHGFFGGNTQVRGSDMMPCTSDARLSESVLILSGAQKNISDPSFNPSREDGILSARELSEMNLEDVELFIASACQSGLGHITSDGVYGIQRGLKNAGVQAMIVSLWNVNDEATRYFMTNLNSALAGGMDLHDAFEHARDRMDDEVTHEEYIYDPGRMRGEYVSMKSAKYSLPRHKNAFILIDNI